MANQASEENEAAFAELLARYRQPVLNFVYRMLGDATEAEDVAQEVFVRAYRHFGEYDPRRKLSTWLFALACNAAIDRLRYRQRHPTELLSDTAAANPVRGPAAEVEAREIGEQIAAAIQSLPEDQRIAVVLAEYHDLSHAEIAGVMRCSEKSVESRLYRARQTLREKLARLLV
jgi:RNA polymerase sigma-70 factor (ECF subfamily)